MVATSKLIQAEKANSEGRWEEYIDDQDDMDYIDDIDDIDDIEYIDDIGDKNDIDYKDES